MTNEKYEALRHILERCTWEVERLDGAMLYVCPACGKHTMYLNDNGGARCSNRECELGGHASPRKIVAASQGLDMELDRQQIYRTVERWIAESREAEEQVRKDQQAAEDKARKYREEANRRAEQQQKKEQEQRAERKRLGEQHGKSEERVVNAGGDYTAGEVTWSMLAMITVFIIAGAGFVRLQSWLEEVSQTPRVPAGSPEAGEASGAEFISGTVPKAEPFYLDLLRSLADVVYFAWPTWPWWMLAGMVGVLTFFITAGWLSTLRQQDHALSENEFIEVKKYPYGKD